MLITFPAVLRSIMHSSSFSLRSCTTLVSYLLVLSNPALGATSSSTASYSLQTNYAGSSFFDGFDFFTDADPTHGFVTYVSKGTAQQSGLISATDGQPVFIGVDSTNKYNGSAPFYGINGVGRPSVRITSKQKFNHGLFIADIARMPGGVCGTWPALWTLGDGTWPYHGEIDIVEGVNTQTQDLTSLHTAGRCDVPGSGVSETGTIQTTNCTYDPNTGDNAAGCGVLSGDTSSFGAPFNSVGGGVFAMEWTSSYIKSWFWRRNAIPTDIAAGNPKPSSWGSPYVNFQGDCNIDANFINHQLVLDTTFCGDWSGAVFLDSCKASTGYSSCSNYVGDNPAAFKNVYWSINSIKVYQQGSSSSSSTTSTTSTPSSKTSTSTTATSNVSSSSSSSSAASSSSSSQSSSTTSRTTTSTTFSTTSSKSTTTTTATTTRPPITTTTTRKTTTTTSTTKTTTTRRRFPRDEMEDGVDEHGYRPIRTRGHTHNHAHRHGNQLRF